MRKPEGPVVHRHHPARFEIKEGLHGIGRIGVYVAELRRIVSSNGQQGEIWRQAASDFAEPGKIRGIARVINRVLAGFQHEAAIPAMRIFQDPGSPMSRRHVRDRNIVVPGTLPPVELDDLGESQIRNQVGNMGGDDDGRGDAARVQIILHNCAQRWAMKVIEMRVRNQHQIDGWKVGNAYAGPAQALEHKQPARKIRIDDDTFSAQLNKETGMSDERDAEFSVRGEARLVSLTATPGHSRMAHQTRELRGSLAKGGIAQCLLDHLKMHVVALQPKRRDEVLIILDDSAALQAAFYSEAKYAGNRGKLLAASSELLAKTVGGSCLRLRPDCGTSNRRRIAVSPVAGS
jgi:hypothetical protein